MAVLGDPEPTAETIAEAGELLPCWPAAREDGTLEKGKTKVREKVVGVGVRKGIKERMWVWRRWCEGQSMMLPLVTLLSSDHGWKLRKRIVRELIGKFYTFGCGQQKYNHSPQSDEPWMQRSEWNIVNKYEMRMVSHYVIHHAGTHFRRPMPPHSRLIRALSTQVTAARLCYFEWKIPNYFFSFLQVLSQSSHHSISLKISQ